MYNMISKDIMSSKDANEADGEVKKYKRYRLSVSPPPRQITTTTKQNKKQPGVEQFQHRRRRCCHIAATGHHRAPRFRASL